MPDSPIRKTIFMKITIETTEDDVSTSFEEGIYPMIMEAVSTALILPDNGTSVISHQTGTNEVGLRFEPGKTADEDDKVTYIN
jgi:hypothetical protein